MVVITYGLLRMNRESEKSFWRKLEEVVCIDCVCKVNKKIDSEDRTKKMKQLPFNWSILYMKKGIYLTAIHL